MTDTPGKDDRPVQEKIRALVRGLRKSETMRRKIDEHNAQKRSEDESGDKPTS